MRLVAATGTVAREITVALTPLRRLPNNYYRLLRAAEIRCNHGGDRLHLVRARVLNGNLAARSKRWSELKVWGEQVSFGKPHSPKWLWRPPLLGSLSFVRYC